MFGGYAVPFFQLPLSPGGGATDDHPRPKSPIGTDEADGSSAQEEGPIFFARDHAGFVEDPSEPMGVKGRVPLAKVTVVPIEAKPDRCSVQRFSGWVGVGEENDAEEVEVGRGEAVDAKPLRCPSRRSS